MKQNIFTLSWHPTEIPLETPILLKVTAFRFAPSPLIFVKHPSKLALDISLIFLFSG